MPTSPNKGSTALQNVTDRQTGLSFLKHINRMRGHGGSGSTLTSPTATARTPKSPLLSPTTISLSSSSHGGGVGGDGMPQHLRINTNPHPPSSPTIMSSSFTLLLDLNGLTSPNYHLSSSSSSNHTPKSIPLPPIQPTSPTQSPTHHPSDADRSSDHSTSVTSPNAVSLISSASTGGGGGGGVTASPSSAIRSGASSRRTPSRSWFLQNSYNPTKAMSPSSSSSITPALRIDNQKGGGITTPIKVTITTPKIVVEDEGRGGDEAASLSSSSSIVGRTDVSPKPGIASPKIDQGLERSALQTVVSPKRSHDYDVASTSVSYMEPDRKEIEQNETVPLIAAAIASEEEEKKEQED